MLLTIAVYEDLHIHQINIISAVMGGVVVTEIVQLFNELINIQLTTL